MSLFFHSHKIMSQLARHILTNYIVQYIFSFTLALILPSKYLFPILFFYARDKKLSRWEAGIKMRWAMWIWFCCCHLEAVCCLHACTRSCRTLLVKTTISEYRHTATWIVISAASFIYGMINLEAEIEYIWRFAYADMGVLNVLEWGCHAQPWADSQQSLISARID